MRTLLDIHESLPYCCSLSLGVSGEVLLELVLTLDVVLGEVLFVGSVHREGAEGVKDKAAADVEGHRVGTDEVEDALDA